MKKWDLDHRLLLVERIGTRMHRTQQQWWKSYQELGEMLKDLWSMPADYLEINAKKYAAFFCDDDRFEEEDAPIKEGLTLERVCQIVSEESGVWCRGQARVGEEEATVIIDGNCTLAQLKMFVAAMEADKRERDQPMKISNVWWCRACCEIQEERAWCHTCGSSDVVPLEVL